MIWFHLLIVLLFIVIGARLGGIGIGLAGAAGVVVLAVTGIHAAIDDAPWDVIGIIMAVICTVAALQVAGSMDYLVHLTEVLLRRHPRQITYLAPFVTFVMSVMCGTGHTAYSVIPVIVDVAKEHGIRPSRPLSIAVVASQVGVAACTSATSNAWPSSFPQLSSAVQRAPSSPPVRARSWRTTRSISSAGVTASSDRASPARTPILRRAARFPASSSSWAPCCSSWSMRR